MADAVDQSPPEDDEPATFHGEEGGDERSSPTKNLGASFVVGAIAIYAIVLALNLEVPTSIYTAPALLPLFTGVTLLIMAVYLGVVGLKNGGGTDFAGHVRRAAVSYFDDEENRRTLFLMAIVVLYVVLVGWIDFELRIPTPVFDFQISSWETISVPMIAWILWIFWRAPVWKCALVSLVLIAFLANTFRYAFYILMPTGA